MTAVLPEAAGRCKHEMTNCDYCKPRPRTQHPKWGPWTQSRINRHCGLCGGPIHERDQMRSNGIGGWLCANCGIT